MARTSRNTIKKYISKWNTLGISYEESQGKSDAELNMLFCIPEDVAPPNPLREELDPLFPMPGLNRHVQGHELSVRLVACMAHIHHGYEKALGEIQSLYRIERMACEKELTPAKRKALRKKLAVPILDSFEQWMEQTYTTVLPKSLMGKTIVYSYSMWDRMKNYLLDGRLEIDNNGVENAVQPIALSHKNFLFYSNHRSAEGAAVICSLLASCKALRLNPREYLTDILSRLP